MYTREDQNYMDDFRLVAHRGLHNLEEGVPENSLAAFERGVRRGRAMELDVHRTADGKLVVFHDSGLQRMCGVPGRIEEWTLSDLKKLRLKGTAETIPTLDEVLELAEGKSPLLIEIKNDGAQPVGPLEEALIGRLNRYSGGVILESFYPPVLAWLHRHAPQYIRGQLGNLEEEGRAFQLYCRYGMFNPITKPDFIAFYIRQIDHRLRLACQKHGVPLVGWTIRNEEDRHRASRLCDGMIYEKLDL